MDCLVSDLLTIELIQMMFSNGPSFDTIGWFAKDIEIFKKIGEVLLKNTDKSEANFNEFVIAEDLLELADLDVQNAFKIFFKDKITSFKKVRLSKFDKAEIADNFRILQGNEVKENVIPWINQNKPYISLKSIQG